MKRTIIHIDEDLCNGCGLCVEGCHEGALQMIDGKARMISDLYCDGLGACIPECPVGAITLVEREAEPYDEIKVMERIAPKGEATILAHLNHLIDYNEKEFAEQGIQYVKDHNLDVDLSRLNAYPGEKKPQTTVMKEHSMTDKKETPGAKAAGAKGTAAQAPATAAMKGHHAHGGGCPGARMMQFGPRTQASNGTAVATTKGAGDGSGAGNRGGASTGSAAGAVAGAASDAGMEGSGGGQPSALRQWPVQLHLVNPQAPYFRKADVLLAADCVAFAMGDFHSNHLAGKGLAIACPKLDQNKQAYVDKLTSMINDATINTLTVMVMEVPCCSGLLQMARQASANARRKVPVKAIHVSLHGEVISEEWLP